MQDRIYLYNKVSQKGYIPFFIIDPEYIDEPLDLKGERTYRFDLLIKADQEYLYDGKEFVKRSSEQTVFFELEYLSQRQFIELNQRYKDKIGNDIPHGNNNDFIEWYAKSLGFKDFNDFSNKFNSCLQSNKNKR